MTSAYSECLNTADFKVWLKDFETEARSEGIKTETISSALHNVQLSTKVIENDRRQKVFSQPFLEFAGRMVSEYRLVNGRKLLLENKEEFQRIESEYGVPSPVLVAFLGS